MTKGSSGNINSPTTIDSELQHYDALAEQWWDPTGSFWPLHKLNQLRMHWIVKQLRVANVADPSTEAPLVGLRVLDVGCGGGILSEALAAKGASVDAIDVVEKNIAIARQHTRQSAHKVNYQVADAQSLTSRSTRYDIVFNMEVVEHVAQFEQFMDTCCELVRPGGWMFVATINRSLPALLIAIFGAEYVLRWLPKGTHHFRRLRKPGELTEALIRNDFHVEQRTGVGVNPFNRTLYLRDSETINYMLMARHCGEKQRQ